MDNLTEFDYLQPDNLVVNIKKHTNSTLTFCGLIKNCSTLVYPIYYSSDTNSFIYLTTGTNLIYDCGALSSNDEPEVLTRDLYNSILQLIPESNGVIVTKYHIYRINTKTKRYKYLDRNGIELYATVYNDNLLTPRNSQIEKIYKALKDEWQEYEWALSNGYKDKRLTKDFIEKYSKMTTNIICSMNNIDPDNKTERAVLAWNMFHEEDQILKQ